METMNNNDNPSARNKEQDKYADLLLNCISNPDLMEDSLAQYLLENKERVVEGFNFVDGGSYGTIKNNLWGEIKRVAGKENQEEAIEKLKKWAKILGKKSDEPTVHKYLKYRFYGNKLSKYKPLFFSNNIEKHIYLDVSEAFLGITKQYGSSLRSPINPEALTDTELRLIINDCLIDDNIDVKPIMKEEKYPILRDMIKEFIINNYEEIKMLGKGEKISFLNDISKGNEIINDAFQSIKGDELNDFIETHKLETQYVKYVKKSNTRISYVAQAIESYKNKEFWMEQLNCYSKEDNKFSVKNAIQYFIEMGDTINNSCEGNNIKIETWGISYFANAKGKTGENDWINLSNLSFRVLELFKDEFKGAVNYEQELEKMMLLAIIENNNYMYKSVRKFTQKENGDYDVQFSSSEYKQVDNTHQRFTARMRADEMKELALRLNEKIPNKGLTERSKKI